MYVCVRRIVFASFCELFIKFWNFSDSWLVSFFHLIYKKKASYLMSWYNMVLKTNTNHYFCVVYLTYREKPCLSTRLLVPVFSAQPNKPRKHARKFNQHLPYFSYTLRKCIFALLFLKLIWLFTQGHPNQHPLSILSLCTSIPNKRNTYVSIFFFKSIKTNLINNN